MLRQISIITVISLYTAAVFACETAVPAGPTDPQIAHIVVTANTIDIKAGKLGQKI